VLATAIWGWLALIVGRDGCHSHQLVIVLNLSNIANCSCFSLKFSLWFFFWLEEGSRPDVFRPWCLAQPLPSPAESAKRVAESAETPSDAHFTDDSAALDSAFSD
jgi:hypothetical protein